MSDIYKTAFALTMEGRLHTQIAEAVAGFKTLDKQIAETQGKLSKLRFGGGMFEGMAKFTREMTGLRGVSTEVASVMSREFKGAFAGINSEINSTRRMLSELRTEMRGLGSSGNRSIRRGGGHGSGGSLLDTIAMGPQHSGIYAAQNVEHSVVGGLLEANGELQRQLNLYRLGGAKSSDVAAARSAAYRSAVLVPDIGVAEQAKLLRELSGATGDEAGARMVLPQAAKTMSIMGAVTGRKSEEDMKRLFKFIELRGVAIDEHTHKIDVNKFGGELDYATKAMVAAQGLITSNDMLQFTKQAGSMAKGMSGEDLFQTMLAGIEDMGGSRAGTSLTAVGRQFIGGIMTGKKADRLDELGLLNKEGVDRTGPHVEITDPTKGIKGYDILTKKGFGAFMEETFRPALAQHGIGGRQQQNEELYRSVGTDTARRLMGLFLSGKEQIDMVAGRYRKAMSGGEGYDQIFGAGQDLQTSTKALHEAFTTLKTALGDAPAVSASMMSLARGIASLAEMAKDHPALGTAATLGGVGASASLLGFGALQTVKGFGLPAAATQLSAAAVALDAAAAKIGGASIAADVAKTAATGGVLAGLGLTGITAGTIAAGAFAGYATGQTLPGIARKEGPGAIDPATGEHLDTAIPQTTPWLRNWIQGWFSSPEAKTAGETVGKQSALATTDGFKTGPFEPAGAAAAMGLLRGFLTGMGGSGVQPASFGGGGLGGLIQKASLGGGSGLGSGIGGNGVVPPGITGSDANLLGLISKYESGGRNTMNYIGDRTHTAQGYYQITNSNWRKIAPRLGITAPNAMAASLAEQARVAQVLLHNGKGIRNWSDYNPKLRGALGRGEHYNSTTQSMPTAGPPPQKQQTVHVHNLVVDGKKMAAVVTSHQTDRMRFATSVGAMDGHGSYRSPGTDAAHAA